MKPEEKPQHVLIIGTVWPEPDSSAAGTRMLQLIELFKAQGWSITFASASGSSEFMYDLESAEVQKVKIELNHESFDSFIRELKPDIVVFDRFMTEEQFGWKVAEYCPRALRILDTEDMHCLRAARQQALLEKKIFENRQLLGEEIAKREIASVLRCDLSLIISGYEMELLKNVFKINDDLLHYIPFMFDPPKESDWTGFEQRNHFISIGNFLHAPNTDSVLYLKEAIWPLIRKQLPEAELHIYGAYVTQRVKMLHNPGEGFLIKGRASDAAEVMRNARVCLATLRFGAGIKGKLIEAMLCGTPSVTTDLGAEAMHDDLKWSGIIANDPEKMAEAAVALYTDKFLWEQARNNGCEIIKSMYSKGEGSNLIKRILLLQQNLEEHRLENFTGAMLMHHTMNSTKYMGKWIEAKGGKR